MINVKFKRNNVLAQKPDYKTRGASGADVYAAEQVYIPSKGVCAVDLGFSAQVPQGYEIQIRPRSGLALNKKVTVLNSPGTVDSDYTGNIKVILVNLGEESFQILPGDRIAQMVICPVEQADFQEVEELGATERGSDGFGSTGVN